MDIHCARMSIEEPGPTMASCYTETSTVSAWSQDENIEEKDEELNGGQEPKSPQKSSSEEDEESEPEFSLASLGLRKVSFADAFGLDLVSVKEFDSRIGTGPDDLEKLGREAREGEEYYLSCIFNIPDSDNMLKLRVRQNKIELESIELLPGSTTVRGIVRVLNLSYHKDVYVRITLDDWQNHFDLLAEYMPGSSDGETDRFSFQLTLLPPSLASAVRVEFCLHYESANETYWANNGGMNYVLFCQQKGLRAMKEKDEGKERETEENNNKGKKSCLKVNSKQSCVDLKPKDISSKNTESPRSEGRDEGNTQQKIENRLSTGQELFCKTLAERCNRRRAIRLAHIQDNFSQRETKVPLDLPTHSKRTEKGTKVVLPMPQLSIPAKIGDTSPILTEHQIPLLSVKWGKPRSCSHPHAPEISNVSNPDIPEKREDEETESSSNAWETFLNGTDSSDNSICVLERECLLCAAGSSAGDKMLSLCRATTGTLGCPLNRGNGSLQVLISEETPESGPADPLQVFNPSHAREVSGYVNIKKTDLSFKTHNVPESESAWVQWNSGQSGVSEAPHDRQAPSERPCKDENPGESSLIVVTTKPDNYKSVDGASLEERAGILACIGTEEKVKGDTQRAINDTLTFTGIRNKPFTDRHIGKGWSSERENTDERAKPEQKKENMSEGNENATQLNRKATWGNYFEPTESSRKGKNEDPSHLRYQNMEFREEILSESENIASRVHEKGSKTKSGDQEESCLAAAVIYGQDTVGHEYIRTESHKLQNSPDTSPHRSMSSHNNDPSKLFSWKESLSEGRHVLFLSPHKNFESEETLRHRAVQDLQGPGEEAETPSSLSTTVVPSVDAMYNWLLMWWVKFCSISHLIGALGYTTLFVILITTYLHDLPVCLVIYLLSVCWWCRQGMKQRVTSANSVD